jgi:transcriptional regulator with XRE-family HTH domain
MSIVANDPATTSPAADEPAADEPVTDSQAAASASVTDAPSADPASSQPTGSAAGTPGSPWDPGTNQLGQYIRLQRQLADLSLRQLADLTKVSNAYLSQVERGLHQPSLRVLRSIANALDVSADTLLAQAGLLDSERAARSAGRNGVAGADGAQASASAAGQDTEAAILADPELTEEERTALLGVYRSFKQRRSSA